MSKSLQVLITMLFLATSFVQADNMVEHQVAPARMEIGSSLPISTTQDEARILKRDLRPATWISRGPSLNPHQDKRFENLRTDSLDLGWVNQFASNSMPSVDDLNGSTVDEQGNFIVIGTSDYQCMTRKYDENGVLIWSSVYERTGAIDTYGEVVTTDAAGNIYIAGFTGGPFDDTNILVVKYDPSGTQVWETSFDGDAQNNDFPTSIGLDGEGNIFVGGYTYDITLTADFLLLKVDPSGNLIWNAQYAASGYADDWITDMAIDQNGDIYVCGVANQEISLDDCMVIKYDTNGEQVYRTTYDAGIQDVDLPTAMTLDDSNRVYVTGVSAGYDGLLDMIAFKLNPDGSGAWSTRYSGAFAADNWSSDVAVDAHYNVDIAGVSYDDPTGFDFVIIQFDSAGNGNWVSRYSSGIDFGFDQAMLIMTDDSSRIIVAGLSESTDGTDNIACVKLDSLGNTLWSTEFATVPAGVELPIGLTLDQDDNILIASESATYELLDNFLVLKYDSTGTLDWDIQYDGEGQSRDAGVALATDGLSNIYVVGQKVSQLTGADITLFKYDSLGLLTWNVDWNSDLDGHDIPADLEVDTDGNVILTGSTETENSGTDILTQMYSSDGVLLWSANYNGPGNNDDEAHALLVDETGNIYVTGFSTGIFTNSDYTTIKYDQLGNEVWVARYVGPNYGSDNAYDLALDHSGNIYVTGSSFRSGFNQDFATVKYDDLGNQVWAARYNGPLNLDDRGTALAVDLANNVYVTGTTTSEAINLDITTIKYSSSGDELWVQHFDGTGEYDDIAAGIVVENQGGCYVGGTSVSLSSEKDLVLIKYSTTGSQVWERSFGGDALDNDQLQNLIKDGTGALYMIGRTVNEGSSADYSTYKVDRDGNTLWTQTLSGVGHSWDDPAAVVVDPRGTIWVTGTTHYFYQGNIDWSDITTVQYLQPEYPVSVNPTLPDDFRLDQNFPNPFNPNTTIRFAVAERTELSLVVFDMLGRKITTLRRGEFEPGYYTVGWNGVDQNGHNPGAGIYFCRLTTESSVFMVKMIYLK